LAVGCILCLGLLGIRVWTFSFSSLSPAAFGPASLICWFKFLIRLLPFARPISRVKSVPSLGIAFRRFAAAGFAAPGSRLIFPLMAPAGLPPVFAFTV